MQRDYNANMMGSSKSCQKHASSLLTHARNMLACNNTCTLVLFISVLLHFLFCAMRTCCIRLLAHLHSDYSCSVSATSKANAAEEKIDCRDFGWVHEHQEALRKLSISVCFPISPNRRNSTGHAKFNSHQGHNARKRHKKASNTDTHTHFSVLESVLGIYCTSNNLWLLLILLFSSLCWPLFQRVWLCEVMSQLFSSILQNYVRFFYSPLSQTTSFVHLWPSSNSGITFLFGDTTFSLFVSDIIPQC